MRLSNVPDPDLFHAETAPLALRHRAGLPGQGLQRAFTYCDLGCGTATTLRGLATLHTEARFAGVDASRLHVDLARTRAAAGGGQSRWRLSA